MFDINDKKELTNAIMNEVEWPNIDLNCGGSPKYEIERAIRSCVESAVISIIGHLYTSREFERDVGLNG